ncbi:AAA+ ATPase domain-containing protein [Cynara cardunculus var. scolymus]|uniref:AAA+ ATPase domain-containing protein n=1 Tax=Cynara cardunculus var. scolymus TaxID=59895 RepID=A0A103XFG6_CYNCS|nr:AAA+ ATPase domain-containing protein [Cynara cardunculus var. scolymus]
MVTGTITAIGSGLSMPLQTLIFGEYLSNMSTWLWGLVLQPLLNPYLLLVEVVCWMVTGERQAARIRSLYLKTILRQDVGFFDQEGKTGEIVERMSGDTVGKFIQLTSTFFGGFVIAFSEGWLLALVLLSSIPLLVISAAFMTVVMTKLMSRGQAAYSAGASVVEQTISSIRTVRILNTLPSWEKEAIAKYEKSLRNAYRAGVQEGLVAGIGSGIFMMCVFCCYSLAIWFGGRLIIEKGYSGGQVINVMIAVLISSFSLGQASPCLSAFASGRVAGFKLFQVIDRKSEIDPYDTRGRKLEDIHGDIELRDITFSYPARPQEKIFNGFSLAIPSGTTAALVGQSGSGKSTVISLLQRFYDPQKGEVVIDDINIKEYHLRWLRGKIGLVSQEPRIAIARAILKDPRILLLDEATSALDAESERVVQEALDRIMVNRTTVIVAHRLTTIQNSDLIALLQDPEGAYSQLIRLQELNKDSEKQEADITVTAASRESSNVGNSNRHSVSTAVSSYFEELKPDQNQPDSHTSSDVSLLRLAYLNKPEILVILLGSIAAVVNGAILPIFGYLLSNIIKIFFKPADELRKESDFWALMLLVLGFASLIATPLRTYFFGVAGCKLIRRIRLRCFQKVVQMEISWFDKAENASGLIGAKLSADAASVRGLVGDTVSLLVQNTATAVAGLLIAFLGNWQLALIILKLYEDASQVASDAVGSIRTVASFCAEEKVMKLYEKKCESPRRAGIQQGLYMQPASMLELVFLGLSMAAMGVSQSGSFVPDSGKAKTATASVFGLLDQKSKIDYTDESGTTLQNVKGDIEFNHVNFKYPSRPDIEIFRDFCLTIPSGKTIALVGESGSGKSTVVSLLQRFYDVDFGRITLDGFDIQKLNVKWLRQQMGLVSQEPVLFNDTIRANIAYGKEGNATEAEVLAAAELANAHKFVSALHQGYDTTVGERGIQLSGGQKQRVAIARAIIKAPKILLLDEATSALDAESEKVVQDALDRVILQQTTVVVAHRLSTIRGADVIVVVKNGMIAEKGKHEKLINMKDGIYASLVALHTNASN